MLRPLLSAGLVGLGDHEAGVWAEAGELPGRGDGVGGVALGGEDEDRNVQDVVESLVRGQVGYSRPQQNVVVGTLWLGLVKVSSSLHQLRSPGQPLLPGSGRPHQQEPHHLHPDLLLLLLEGSVEGGGRAHTTAPQHHLLQPELRPDTGHVPAQVRPGELVPVLLRPPLPATTSTVTSSVVTDQSRPGSLHGGERHVTGHIIEPGPQLRVLGSQAVTPDKLDGSLRRSDKAGVSLDTVGESDLDW